VRERYLPIEELLSERSGRQRRARTIDPGTKVNPMHVTYSRMTYFGSS